MRRLNELETLYRGASSNCTLQKKMYLGSTFNFYILTKSVKIINNWFKSSLRSFSAVSRIQRTPCNKFREHLKKIFQPEPLFYGTAICGQNNENNPRELHAFFEALVIRLWLNCPALYFPALDGEYFNLKRNELCYFCVFRELRRMIVVVSLDLNVSFLDCKVCCIFNWLAVIIFPLLWILWNNPSS